MKETPSELRIHNNMKAGYLTVEGFLGKDDRHFHDIIREDHAVLQKISISAVQLAERMEYFTGKAFEIYDGAIIIDEKFRVEYKSYRGKIICPFAHPGVFRKGEIFFKNLENGIELCWTPLNIHMIAEHGFFEGKGSKHRLDPVILKQALFGNGDL
ncbi:MAG: hypothetical protein JXB60_02750 [Candidatus Cloacimonetes bacterium]|nr:hypothetical protein [Candidatus Cloacimonadota bacterium]